MKRRHSRAQALDLIAAVRAARPDIALGADFIAGFPTESDAAFENTLAFVEEAGLAFLHVFPYSPRPGTPAARMPQVAGAVIKARAARLRAAGDAALIRHLDRQIGAHPHRPGGKARRRPRGGFHGDRAQRRRGARRPGYRHRSPATTAAARVSTLP